MAKLSRCLSAGVDPNAKDDLGKTVLMNVTGVGLGENVDPELVRLFIDAGADPNARDNLGFTVLARAASFGRNAEVLRMLLEAGAGPLAQVGANRALAYLVWNERITEILQGLPSSSRTKQVIMRAFDRVVDAE